MKINKSFETRDVSCWLRLWLIRVVLHLFMKVSHEYIIIYISLVNYKDKEISYHSIFCTKSNTFRNSLAFYQFAAMGIYWNKNDLFINLFLSTSFFQLFNFVFSNLQWVSGLPAAGPPPPPPQYWLVTSSAVPPSHL